VIDACDVTFAFPHEAPVLDRVSFRAVDEVVAVTGSSGSGKTTLLLCLAGILQPSAGAIAVGGEPLTGVGADERSRIRRQRLGLVFQYSELVAELTLAENIALPLELLGESRRAATQAARDLLAELGIDDVAGRYPAQVSGGQAQRAAVGRALIHRPAVVLADEPTGSLDAVNAEKVLRLLLAAARSRGAAVVLVTHDREVAAHADREVNLTALTGQPRTVTR
jgi:putative ABC transport system ATP-binding protein